MNEVSCLRIENETGWREGFEEIEGEAVAFVGEPGSLQVSSGGLTLKPNSRKGTFLTRVTGDKDINSSWRSIIVDAEKPEKSQVIVAYAASDNNIANLSELLGNWSDAAVNPAKLVLRLPRSKYFWLKLTLIADEETGKAPTIHGIQISYSATTYLDYLPAIYQENPVSKSLLEKYLAVFETSQAKVDNAIVKVPRLIDAEQTPSAFLPWLSTWVGASMDENWPEEKWRIFLSRAVELYRIRGTKNELKEIIEIYTGKHPYAIVERALLHAETPEYERLLNRLFGDSEYAFRVILDVGQINDEKDAGVVTRIIENEKPAHTQGCFIMLENKIMLDWYTFLGYNSYIAEPPKEMHVGEAKVSVNTIIAMPPKDQIVPG
jgi:phage tail-like protein